ncbi:ABC transporter ATP-binding protein [Pseudoclavibacter caeni]|jgi:putative ABC transport system ATP-binding protein|uniref:ABC transporter ATP-binding protein n=1 Tax=Pseudoclavibacter caeni TaxID=908846 RepID=A0A7C8BN28_9MICO|nr:ABC transporter ATP-binding protein [Pseudoclavibacter caeni]KAB1631991.1 ABC transporter ATP-binding protein [Pseudoclavibacter caeni]NYJ96799.1 putative ABC transport system ATP-binding protein [Pseudoclavibacter caeni]
MTTLATAPDPGQRPQRPEADRPDAASPADAARAGTDRIAVRAEDLVKVYGRGDTQVTAIDHVDLVVSRGEFTAIMGPSGSGKSTLMHVLAGLDTATDGHAWIGDTEVTGLGDRELTRLRRAHVGFVFQSFNLVPTLTAEQNITLPARLARQRIDRSWLDEVVTRLGIADRLRHRPSELSGGQQQRVAIARALLTRPDVVFADEPTGNLDSASGTEVLTLLRRSAREMGQTIIMVTHDPVAAAYADRVLVYADGRIAREARDADADAILRAVAELGAVEGLVD